MHRHPRPPQNISHPADLYPSQWRSRHPAVQEIGSGNILTAADGGRSSQKGACSIHRWDVTCTQKMT